MIIYSVWSIFSFAVEVVRNYSIALNSSFSSFIHLHYGMKSDSCQLCINKMLRWGIVLSMKMEYNEKTDI